MKQPRKIQRSPAAFALIITVITVALLTIMAVAFLSSSTLERATSRASVNKTKAELAARAAAQAAIAQVVDTISKFPDSATSWETINGASGTMLYYRDQTPEQATASATAAKLYVLPLISGGTAQLTTAKTTALPTLADSPAPTSNAFNFNHQRFAGDTQGWIGAAPSPVPASTPPPLRGQWINLTDSDSKITGRYAYWMEDESFKANANLLGKTTRGATSVGAKASEIPLQGVLATVSGSTNGVDTPASDIFDLRATFPASKFFEFRSLNRVTGQDTLAEKAKFVSTIFSSGLNLSRSGGKRVNLNKIVTTSTVPAEIRTQLDEIIKAITYDLPNFAQRFYRKAADLNIATDVGATGNPSDQIIYLNKIAANIRDYIDTDSQPTIVKRDLSVNISTTASPPPNSLPGGGASGANDVIAIGKDAAPFIHEYMLRVKQIDPKLRSLPSGTAQYKIEIDHYVEFWNMTNQDITVSSLGPNPFLRIGNQFGWTSYGGVDIPVSPTRDFSIPLSAFKNTNGDNLVFAAGKATVLTTDPAALPATLSGVDPKLVFRPPTLTPVNSFRVYSGTCKAKSSGNYPHLDAQPRPNNTSSSGDMETEITLGNDNGVLESFGAPDVYYITVNADDGTQTTNTTRIDTTKYYFRASSVKGNVSVSPTFPVTPSQNGDPRTNNEQLTLDPSTAQGEDRTSFKTELNGNTPPSATNNDASLTNLNTTYVAPSRWIDPSSDTALDALHAPARIANGNLTSIGQLGDVFDPVRLIGVSNNINYSRGGGRALKVGQPNRYDATDNSTGLWDGDSNSASREWTAWRLADVFGTSDSLQLDGLININGVNRDSGAALRAALFGYLFQADSDPNLAGAAFDADPNDTNDKVSELVRQLQARITNDGTAYGAAFSKTAGPLAERGELSELPIFNTGHDLTPSVDTSKAYDRGREEMFRRLAELITTRGNIFSVYAVGQSLIPSATGGAPIVTSTSQLKVTFRIDPVWDAGTPSDPFDPTKIVRFAKPDHYAIKVLYAGS